MIGQKQFGSPAGPQEAPITIGETGDAPEGLEFVPSSFDETAGVSDKCTVDGGEVSLTLTPTNEAWLIERLSLYSNSGQAFTVAAKVYLRSRDDKNLVEARVLDFVNDSHAAVADPNNPIRVPVGTPLIIWWNGVQNNAVGVARVQYVGGKYVKLRVIGGTK